MFTPLTTTVRVCAWLACATVLGMIGIFFATGVGQDALQFVHTPDEYLRLLLANPGALRATVGLDNLFIVLYTTTFIALAGIITREGAPKLTLRIALGALLLLAVLDMVENFHFMTMLSAAELGIAPSSAEIRAQVWESLLKFHVGYLGLFLVGFAIPRETAGARLLSNLSWYVQLPVGVLIYVMPRAIGVPLVFVRFTYFVVALILVGLVFGAGDPRPGPVAIGSGAPA